MIIKSNHCLGLRKDNKIKPILALTSLALNTLININILKAALIFEIRKFSTHGIMS